jgi:uncharacterized DUF497 family protein
MWLQRTPLFEWDENKRCANLARHHLDLIDGQALFDGRPVITYSSPRDGEPRFVTVGRLGPKFFSLVWTSRGDAIRLTSFRRARDGEERLHRARIG